MTHITNGDLVEILVETGQRHHAAFLEAGGIDPEWPLFYAAQLHARVWDRLGVVLTRSEIVHVIVAADLAMQSGEASGDWPVVHAEHLLAFAADKAQRAG